MTVSARPIALGAALAVVLAVAIVAAVVVGPADIGVSQIWASVAARLSGAPSPLSVTQEAIVWELRVPRVLTAALVGAGLAVVGAVMQAMTGNPLADPYLLGLSSGASVGAVVVVVLGVSLLLPVAAFVGALGAALLVLALGGTTVPMRTILAGVAVSAALSAITSFVVFWSATGDTYRELLGWLLGSLAGATWSSVAVVATATLVVGMPLALSSSVLDAFAFGDRTAGTLGVDVPRARRLLLIGCALLTGALVAVSGAIGFIGLVIPHAVRLLVGSGHRAVLPLGALGGATLLVAADTVARSLFAPRELPVGVLTALVGAPVFAALLWRQRRAG